MENVRVLVVDDDAKVRTLLRRCLESDGYSVSEADGAEAALAAIDAATPSLITLDINLGETDGLEVARIVRRTSDVPIIMVSGKDDVIDRVVGLEIGADDYITKPFHVREVLARVRTVLRRAAARATTDDVPGGSDGVVRYEFDGLVASPERFELQDRDGLQAQLTSGEFKLLAIFLARPKRVISREALMDLLGGAEWTPLDRTIDNQVARLRKKVERDSSNPTLIKSVRGVGYVLACDVKQAAG